MLPVKSTGFFHHCSHLPSLGVRATSSEVSLGVATAQVWQAGRAGLESLAQVAQVVQVAQVAQVAPKIIFQHMGMGQVTYEINICLGKKLLYDLG